MVLSLGKGQQCGIQHHLHTDPCCSGGGFGCGCRALLTLPVLWSAQGCRDEPELLQHLRLHGFLSLMKCRCGAGTGEAEGCFRVGCAHALLEAVVATGSQAGRWWLC